MDTTLSPTSVEVGLSLYQANGHAAVEKTERCFRLPNSNVCGIHGCEFIRNGRDRKGKARLICWHTRLELDLKAGRSRDPNGTGPTRCKRGPFNSCLTHPGAKFIANGHKPNGDPKYICETKRRAINVRAGRLKG